MTTASEAKGEETEIVFVGGLSGSGKSTAMAALEDLSFYCVDNLPPQLIPQFLDVCRKSKPPIAKVAMAVDGPLHATRDERSLSDEFEQIEKAKQKQATPGRPVKERTMSSESLN